MCSARANSVPELIRQFPRPGELVWIGLRPGRGQAMLSVADVLADTAYGLDGDRYQGSNGKRQVSLMQWEHLAVISALTGKSVTPDLLRRNLVIKGINLLALKDRRFRIGAAEFAATGLCHPCSRMEHLLGPGGYNAMRGHGGLTAQVIGSGIIRLGDQLIAE
ncbi:MAG: MOSC domain-containing protein [Methylobacter sp.]|nr:MAG: MOSC domain-containing protein [Methylobacter sp.]PPD17212.1 MAG: MOSC domain-containing protein [Methylobacter sp.]